MDFSTKKYIELTVDLYNRYGYTTFIIGRFLPVFRTFIPILAGIVKLDFKRFLLLNVVGAVLWITPLVLMGHWMESRYPKVVESLELIIVGMIVITGLPVAFSWIKSKYNKNELNQNKHQNEK